MIICNDCIHFGVCMGFYKCKRFERKDDANMRITGYEADEGKLSAVYITDETRGIEQKRYVEERPTVAYICKERKKGGTCPGNSQPCSYEICHHTTDIKYAKNFLETGDGTYAELDTWIPCSPGMKPKPFIKVLFCDMDGEIYKGHKTDKGRWYSVEHDDPIKNVVAWMFLPEPYEVEGDKK